MICRSFRILPCYVVLKIIIAKKDVMSGDNYVLLVSCRYAHIVDKCYYVCGRLGCASHCLYGFAAIVSHRIWHIPIASLMSISSGLGTVVKALEATTAKTASERVVYSKICQ